MIIDSREVANGHLLQADVCIIGAGPAGITVALGLLDSGLTVLLLESGGDSPDEESQVLSGGENIGIPYDIGKTRARAVGGTAHLWNDPGVRMRPLDEADFQERSWAPYSGWPLSFSELASYYDRACALLMIGTDSFEPDPEQSQPALEPARLETTLFRYGNNGVYYTEHRQTLRNATNCHVYTHATVVDLVLNEAGRSVERVSVRAANGNRFSIQAERVVLAGGGIENPRLLLAAESQNGLGNEHDLVGRFFMEHPSGVTAFLVPANTEVDSLMYPYHFHDDTAGVLARWHLALNDEVNEAERILRYNVCFWPTEPEWMPDALARLARRQLSQMDADSGRRLWAISVMAEQAPNPESRVTLSDQIGSDGQPLARLDWRLSQLDIHTLVRGQQIVQEEFQLAGLGSVFTMPYVDSEGGFLTPYWDGYPAKMETPHHHMGTTRMSIDPRQGVVDPDCRLHTVSNLYIAGSSVFPTGGFANPTLTIVALAARLADCIRDSLA